MNLAWISPLHLAVLVLASYRVTRLWIDDTLPPLPQLRAAVHAWGAGRLAARLNAAIQADRRDPKWIAESDEAGKRAFRGGYQAPIVMGDREHAERLRQDLHGGEHPVTSLVGCYWCVGFWVALLAVLLASLLPVAVWLPVAAVLALSATTGLLSQANH